MILKDVVRFFKVTSAGYEPLPWALYHAGFYNSLAAYKKPIVAWSDGTQAIEGQYFFKEGKIFNVKRINTQGVWTGLETEECKGVLAILREFEQKSYYDQYIIYHNDKLYVCTKPGFHVAFNETNWQLATDKLLLTTVMHFKDSVLAEGSQINSDGVLVNLAAATEIDGTPVPPVKPVKYKSLSFFNDMTPRAIVGFKLLNVTISDPVDLVDVVVQLHVMSATGSIKSTHPLTIASRTNGILDAFPDSDIPCGPNEYFGISLISPTEKDAITSFMGAVNVPGKYVVNGGNVFLTLSGDTPQTTFDLEVVTQKYH